MTDTPAEGNQDEKWRPAPLPKTGVQNATFSLPVKLLQQIDAEVREAKEAGFNATKSGLVAEALEMLFNSRRRS